VHRNFFKSKFDYICPGKIKKNYVRKMCRVHVNVHYKDCCVRVVTKMFAKCSEVRRIGSRKVKECSPEKMFVGRGEAWVFIHCNENVRKICRCRRREQTQSDVSVHVDVVEGLLISV